MWNTLAKPFFVLAPLDDVTDVVFREIVTEIGKPDALFTEFTNCDALFSKGREATLARLKYTENQRPIVAQLWGSMPVNFYKSAQLAVELGFDGIDINMGCPDKSVRQTGACSALIDNRLLAAKIIAATKEGAGQVPVSVKTRLGVNYIATEDWISWLLQQDLAAIIIHGRTVREMSNVPAHWDEIGRAVKLRNQLSPTTYIVGNGDVMSLAEARQKASQFGVDGVMIGRGIFKNLSLFHPVNCMVSGQARRSERPISDRLTILRRHVELFRATWGNTKNPATVKKFIKMYISDFPGAPAWRKEFMRLPTLEALISSARELEAMV